ncbi:hypothetical protein D5086_028651 [Populus alba]|uniref:Uncharacterized protein n=1 Tax=Populus alba TaxID=43335 RepID=A0ACC4AS38_POPAL
MKFGAMQVHENAKWSNAGAVQKPEERAFKHIQGSIYGRCKEEGKCEKTPFFSGERQQLLVPREKGQIDGDAHL